MPGIDLGGFDLPSLLPHAPPFFYRRQLQRLPPPRPIQGHHRLLPHPQTFVGSILAHDIVADSLASSGNGPVDTGAPSGSAFRPPIVLPIAHHWRLRFSPPLSFIGPFSSHSYHRSATAAGNPGSTADHGFPASTCGHGFKIIVAPVAVGLLRDQSSAFTSSSQPEIRLRLNFIAVVTTKHRRRPRPSTAQYLASNSRWRTRPFLAATKQPRCAVTVGYFRFSTLTVAAA